MNVEHQLEGEASAEDKESSLERAFDQREVDEINELIDRVGGITSVTAINRSKYVSESQRRDIRNYVAEWKMLGGIDNARETKRIALEVNKIVE